MVESDERAGHDARSFLEVAGHDVLACVKAGASPCVGVAGGVCPLEAGAAVAVSAPAGIPAQPRAGDVGVICALRHHLPLVVASPDGDLVAEVEAAALAPLPAHTEVVGREVPTGSAAVTRVDGGLLVEVAVPDGTDERTREIVAIRAQGALRRLDPWASTIDVRVTST
jgi:hypothetical protein